MKAADGADERQVLGLITARRNSKGLPDKHLRPLGGRPLIDWTFDAAKSSRRLTRTIISTDDERLITRAHQAGIEAPFVRPAALAQDDTGHTAVVEHALTWVRQQTGQLPDYLVLLQPTSPLRSGADIDQALALLAPDVAAVVSVTECREHPALCYKIREGWLDPYAERSTHVRRQDFPEAYRVNGAIYVIRPDAFLADGGFVPQGSRPYVMPWQRSADIDSIEDLEWAEHCLAIVRRQSEQDEHASI